MRHLVAESYRLSDAIGSCGSTFHRLPSGVLTSTHTTVLSARDLGGPWQLHRVVNGVCQALTHDAWSITTVAVEATSGHTIAWKSKDDARAGAWVPVTKVERMQAGLSIFGTSCRGATRASGHLLLGVESSAGRLSVSQLSHDGQLVEEVSLAGDVYGLLPMAGSTPADMNLFVVRTGSTSLDHGAAVYCYDVSAKHAVALAAVSEFTPLAWMPAAHGPIPPALMGQTIDQFGYRRPSIWYLGNPKPSLYDIPLAGNLAAIPLDSKTLLVTQQLESRRKLFGFDTESGRLSDLGPREGSIVGLFTHKDGTVYVGKCSATSPGTVHKLVRDSRPAPLPLAFRSPSRAPDAAVDVGTRVERAVAPWGPIPYVLTVPAINQVGTAFCIHGGPYAVDLDEFDALSQRLAAKGFVVVRVNYRGSVGFGHDWMLANRTDPGWAELEDINFVRSQLVARSALPNLPMVICGSSWGGYIALLAAGLDGNNWSGVSARSPIGDYLACYSGEHEGAREFDRFLFGGPPSELRDKYIRASPSTYCSLVTAPVQS